VVRKGEVDKPTVTKWTGRGAASVRSTRKKIPRVRREVKKTTWLEKNPEERVNLPFHTRPTGPRRKKRPREETFLGGLLPSLK